MTAMGGGPVRVGVPEVGTVPRYYLAKIAIDALVDALGEGAAVPSERDLAARFGVARETIRQALQELLVEGRILVALDAVAADAGLAAQLAVAPSASVLHLERVLLSDGEPMGLESTYLSAARFPRLRTDVDPATSLCACVRSTGVTFHTATEHIETVLASPREAALLATNPALPMLMLNRVSRDPDGRPIERVRSLFRGDRFSPVAELAG